MRYARKVLAALASGPMTTASASSRTWRSETQGGCRPRTSKRSVDPSLPASGGETYDHAPELLGAYQPYCPAKLLARSQGGRCVLGFTVTAAGTVEGVKAIEGNPAICAHPAIARGYLKFRPATLKGTAAPYTLTIPFTFEVK